MPAQQPNTSCTGYAPAGSASGLLAQQTVQKSACTGGQHQRTPPQQQNQDDHWLMVISGHIVSHTKSASPFSMNVYVCLHLHQKEGSIGYIYGNTAGASGRGQDGAREEEQYGSCCSGHPALVEASEMGQVCRAAQA